MVLYEIIRNVNVIKVAKCIYEIIHKFHKNIKIKLTRLLINNEIIYHIQTNL